MQEMQIQVKGRSVTELLLPGCLHTAERDNRSFGCRRVTVEKGKLGKQPWEHII